jgi:hypothetical protein
MMMPPEEMLVPTWMIQVSFSNPHLYEMLIILSGFFSVQVLEEALNIWQLRFVKVAFHAGAAPYAPSILAWYAGALKL